MPIKEIILHIYKIFQIVFLVWIVMGWIPELRRNNLYYQLNKFFDYLLAPIRKIIPPIGGVLDISPIIFMLILQFVLQLLFKLF